MDVTPYEQLEALLTLLVAATLGAVLGLNREWSRRPAGLRTHAGRAGAALVMVLSRLHFSPDTAWPDGDRRSDRIGFLGGGDYPPPAAGAGPHDGGLDLASSP